MWRSVIASLLILGGALGMSWSDFGYNRAGAAYVKKRRAERGLLKVGSPPLTETSDPGDTPPGGDGLAGEYSV